MDTLRKLQKTVGLVVTTVALVIGSLLAMPALAQLGAEQPSVEMRSRQAVDEAIRGFIEQGKRAADGPLTVQSAAQVGTKMAGFTCLPTCIETDAKFLALAGTARQTLSSQGLDLQVSAPAGSSSFLLGFFDGDGSRPTATGTTRWDGGNQTLYRYTLFADPAADGSGNTIIPLSGQSSILSTGMADSAWSDFTVNVLATGDPAAAPSGNLFYRLRIEVDDPNADPNNLNVFKVRATGVVSIRFNQQPFSYVAGIGTDFEDLTTVYPDFPNVTPTNYDGEFSFFFDTAVPQQAIEIFDGDFDHGDQDGISNQDTDDANSPNTVPDFAPPGSGAAPEGVAVGLAGATGDPPDNTTNPFFLREPSVVFDIITPALQVFTEDNPSGNREWERFLLSTSPANNPDEIASALPAGAYEFRARGVDLVNLNALRLPFRLLCVDALGDVCTPLRPFLIGDTVFTDVNSNGIQDAGDDGIGGVVVNLLTDLGAFIASTTTLPDGTYNFEVDGGTYQAEIDPSNFTGAGVLAGRSSTTGGETMTDTVVDDNVLTYDFGYTAPANGSIGDFVWFDDNQNGVQDEPTGSGLNNVTVTLFDSGGGIVATGTTDSNGAYLFEMLEPGTYTVQVSEATLPASLFSTTVNNPLVVNLGLDESFGDADFGYGLDAFEPNLIGDFVWQDANDDGIQDGAEPGIDGVTVLLEGDIDSDGLPDVFRGFVTQFGGGYLFELLPVGTYTVTVDTSTLPVGITIQTFDLDGLGTPDAATGFLGAADFRADFDFGYRGENLDTAALGNRVWLDDNGNGVQDPGEDGINGVTITLRDSASNVVGTRTTSGDGDYTFTDLPAGTYTVHVNTGINPDLTQTFDLDGTLDNQTTLTLGAGEVRDDVDFGYDGDLQCLPDIGFDLDANGQGLATGQVIDDEFAAFGITVTTHDPANHPAMIFDSANPTGGDFDLGTPNQDFGGPGVGAGGGAGQPGQNDTALGKVLIISEDGDSNDPDDNASGGTIIFTFDQPARVDEIVILDIDESTAGEIEAFDGGGAQIGTAAMASNLGNNSVQTVSLGFRDVRRLEVHFPGSGAVAGLSFCVDPVACSPKKFKDSFNVVSFNNNDGPDDWSGPWMEVDGNGAGPSTGNVIVSGGFLKLDDRPNTGGEPGVSREADLSGAATATLTFDFDTSHGVDHNDAVTVDISDDGGATWTVLEVITGITGEVWDDRSFDITPFISSQTQVRFRVTNLYGGSNETFFLGFVKIVTRCDGAPEPKGSIGDTVWNDENGDGVQDGQEGGIEYVTVKLKDSDGNVIGMDVTDQDGKYLFEDLSADTYTVKVVSSTLPADFTIPTFDLDGTGTAHKTMVTLAAGEDQPGADFGYKKDQQCSGCEHYSGSLWDAGDWNQQPDGTYYWSDGGTHEAWLEGDGDFDLYLYKWNGNGWSMIASSDNPGTSSEHVAKSTGSGYFTWLVYAHAGSGDYEFWLDRP